MKTSTNKTMTTYIEPTEANVKAAIENIKVYAVKKDYQLIGDLKDDQSFLQSIFSKGLKLEFESKSLKKVCRDYLTRLDRKMSMSVANRFLHFLFKRIYKIETPAPRVEYSERELKIQASRKAWKKSQAETEKLRLNYKELKSGFYK